MPIETLDDIIDDRQERYDAICKVIDIIGNRSHIGTLGEDTLFFLDALKREVDDEINGGWWEERNLKLIEMINKKGEESNVD